MRPSDGKRVEALVRVPSKIERFIRLPDTTGHGKARFVALEAAIGCSSHGFFLAITVTWTGRLPRHPRQRSRSRRRSRRSGAAVRDGAEAPPPRIGDPARIRRAHARGSARASSPRNSDVADDEIFLVDGMLALNDLSELVAPRPAGSEIQALQSALSRTRPRPWRRLFCRDQAEGSRRPSPLRVFRRRRAIPQSGGARSERASRSSRRSTAPLPIARSCGRSSRRPRPANRSPRLSS